METVGNGKIWSNEFLEKHLELAEKEWKQPKETFIWVIEYDEKIIGYIRWKKKIHLNYEFINKDYQNKGVGTISTKESLRLLENI